VDHLTATRYDLTTGQHPDGQHPEQQAERLVDAVLQRMRQPLVGAVVIFFEKPISPLALMAFEMALLHLVREIGRLLLEGVLNACEPERSDELPKDLWFESGGYRRRNQKTANRHVASRFGIIILHRYGYRSWHADDGSIFPLEMRLGLNHSATPALADWIGRRMAAAGATQAAVIELLRTECGVTMGVKRLRQIVDHLSESMETFRQACQVDVLLESLEKAMKSDGSRRPVLAVGRDGVTLCEHNTNAFQVATTGTVSVYDRRGKRLKTVYLAHSPELGQATMDQMLTRLLNELFARYIGPLPRLAYITDSGSNETNYFRNVLRRMVHPLTGKRLKWTRVADFYHASERIWTMSELLFGQGTRAGKAWAHRMLKSLKKPSGASRVPHSAATLFHRRQRRPGKLSEKKKKRFWTAYRYIQSRTKLMRYSEYASLHIPLGSGVTEAACKTVFTQRLKGSGMRFSHAGAKAVLTLRTILLSGSWAATYSASLTDASAADLRTYSQNPVSNNKTAA
jgi:hypothetical protein